MFVGSDDLLADPVDARSTFEILKNIPGSTFSYFENMGHATFLIGKNMDYF